MASDGAFSGNLINEAANAARLFQRGLRGDLNALDEAVRLSHQVQCAVPREHPQHPAMVINYCTALIRRYETRGDEEDLHEAVRLLRAENQEVDRKHQYRPEILQTLGWALLREAELTGDTSTINEAVRARRDALAATGRRSPDRDQRLCDLAGVLASQGVLTNDFSALREAVRIHSAVVRRTPADHPQYANRLSLLGVAEIQLYEYTGDTFALDAGLDAHRHAMAAAQPHDQMHILYSNIGIALGIEFERRGDADSLEESITLLRQALEAAPPGRFDRPRCLLSLATALQRKFETTGSLEALNNAIGFYRQAIGEARPSHPQHARALSGLGGALILRYMRIGDADSRNEALHRLADAVDATPDNHPNRPDRLSALACARHAAFKSRPTMYPQITDPVREALKLAPREQVRRALYLSNLGAFLNDEFELTGDRAVLAEAVELNAAAVAQTPPGHMERGKRLANWSISISNQALLSSDPAEAAKAVAVCDSAVGEMDVADPDRAQSLLALAQAIVHCDELAGNQGGLARILEVCREAAEHPTAPTLIRIRAAHTLGDQAARAGDPATGLEGLAMAVGMMTEAAWRGLDRDALVEVLGRLAQLPEDAAALALENGQPYYAVELIEQGRGVLLAQTLDDRTSYDQLYDRAPKLAVQLAGVLHALATVPQPVPGLEEDRIYGAPEHRSPMDERSALAAERDDLLERIRQLPGLEDFLRPQGIDDLLGIGEHGPVVIINVSVHRCDALAITQDGVTAIPLPGLTFDRATRWSTRLASTVTAAHSDQRPGSAANRVILEILAEIGDAVTTPVLNALGLGLPQESEAAPRVWWCPTGPTAALPLHAAGQHEAGAATTLDLVTSSYTPTLRALNHLRQLPVAPTQLGSKPLIVAMPETPGQRPLPGTRAELDYLTAHFPDHTLLSGPNATLAAVTTAMPEHAWVHFSCHGQRDTTTHSGDRLLLQDEPLMAHEIANMDVGDASLAFLSACDTYTTGDIVPDECLTIGAALQLAGYRYVIATQWPVYDNSTADLAAHVYGLLRQGACLDTPQTAEALRSATLEARRKALQEPTRWVPYIHLGPL